MLLILYRDSVWRELRKEAKRHVKVANGVQADVKAVGDVSLELADGFILSLRDVLYVPSLQRNLISVSCLDNDGLNCHFRDGKCEILCNNEYVGLAFQKEDLDLLSLRENMNSVCVAEPPKLYGPHALVIVPKTSDGCACAPDNLRRSVECPQRTPIQLHLTTHTRINKGVNTTLQHLIQNLHQSAEE
jgi:hypothetical protein